MYKEPRPMKEIHEIQEKIYEEQKHIGDKGKLNALHREAEETEKKYGIALRKISHVK
jgi:hypothetical protein